MCRYRGWPRGSGEGGEPWHTACWQGAGMVKTKTDCVGCGNAEVQQLEHDKSVMLLCPGCGLVVGHGADAVEAIRQEIAEGRAVRLEAEPGFAAMRMYPV